MIPGTAGYEKSVERFLEISRDLKFEDSNGDFLPYLPSCPARVLDVGCGVGQNAAALSERGYSVVAVEPMRAFLSSAYERYKHLPIEWQRGSLPLVACLGQAAEAFHFILIDAVWHHLNQVQRDVAIFRIAEMLLPGGRCAISLRNGPPGLGTCVYPTSVNQLLALAKTVGLSCVMKIENQPSILPYKAEVSWSRLVLEKPS